MAEDTSMKSKDWVSIADDVYRDSTTWLNKALKTQWRDAQLMYNNKHPSKSKYNNSLYSKRSKIFRPKIRSTGTKFVAAASTAYFTTDDKIQMSPVNDSIQEQVDGAKLMANLVDYRLTHSIPWYLTLTGAAEEAWKMGAVFSYQHWETEYDRDGNIVVDRPRIDLIPQENVRISPGADWTRPIESSPYVVRLSPMFIYDIKEKIRDSKVNGSFGDIKWESIDEGDLITAKDQENNFLRTIRSGGSDPEEEKSNINDYDTIYIHENFVKREGKDWIYFTLGTTKLLSKPMEVTERYPQGRPLVLGSVLTDPFKPLKDGVPKLVQPIQEEINNVVNDRLDNVHYVLHKRYFGRKGRNIDIGSLIRNIPGSITMMDDPQGDVQVVPTQDVTASAYKEQNLLNVDFDETAGNFSVGSVQTNKSLNETVGGMGMINAGASQITEYYLRVFNTTWVEPVIDQLISLIKFYETDEIVLNIAANKAELDAFTLSKNQFAMDNLLSQPMTLNINMGLSATNPSARLEKFLFGINSLSQIYSSPHANRLNQDEVTKEVMGLLGHHDGSRFANKDMQDPQIQELQQQLQQAQQIIESKQIETQAKMQIEQANLMLKERELGLKEVQLKSDIAETDADIKKVDAEIQKIYAEIDKLVNTDNTIEMEQLRLKAAELANDREKFTKDNQTKRDSILAGMIKEREANDMKLKITLANQNYNMFGESPTPEKEDTGDNLDNNIVTRATGGPVDPNQQALVGEEGPEIIVPTEGLQVIDSETTKQFMAEAQGLAPKLIKNFADLDQDRQNEVINFLASDLAKQKLPEVQSRSIGKGFDVSSQELNIDTNVNATPPIADEVKLDEPTPEPKAKELETAKLKQESVSKVIDDVKRDEGFRRDAYWDKIGRKWTIGFGTTKGVKKGDKITEKEANARLMEDLDNSANEASKLVDNFEALPQDKKEVLINMVYNMGLPKTKKFKKMIAAIEANNFELAADEMLKSKWAGQVKGRAERLANIMRGVA